MYRVPCTRYLVHCTSTHFYLRCFFFVSLDFSVLSVSPGWSASVGSPSPSFREKLSFLLSVTSYGRSVFMLRSILSGFVSKIKLKWRRLFYSKHPHDASRTMFFACIYDMIPGYDTIDHVGGVRPSDLNRCVMYLLRDGSVAPCS